MCRGRKGHIRTIEVRASWECYIVAVKVLFLGECEPNESKCIICGIDIHNPITSRAGTSLLQGGDRCQHIILAIDLKMYSSPCERMQNLGCGAPAQCCDSTQNQP